MKTLLRFLYALNRLRWRIVRPITLGVKLLLVQEGGICLVRHTYQSGWHLVGGGVKRGERMEEAGRREAREEVGAALGELRLFGLYANFQEGKSDHIAVFVCSEFTLAGARSAEIAEWRMFPLGELPADVSPGSMRRISEYLDGRRVPATGAW